MPAPDTQSTIAGLERQFPREEIRQRQGGGGRVLDYVDWPTVVRRLNSEVGVDNYDFSVSDLQLTPSAAICKGRLTVRFPDGTVSVKEQFGGNPLSGGMSIDDAAKGAGSDALKKCAALFGVALDLSEKDAPAASYSSNNGNSGYGGGTAQGYSQNNGYSQSSLQSAPQSNGMTQGQAPQGGGFEGGTLYCEKCNEQLAETRFKDGTTWSPEQLAAFGRRKHNRVLCMSDYREANTQKRQAEESVTQAPF